MLTLNTMLCRGPGFSMKPEGGAPTDLGTSHNAGVLGARPLRGLGLR